ncbi:hypothetical protein KYK29_06400 [Shinella daejeonensis]|uniref:hypothetical protein n=1 Tax=Shinella daejeonensis TaxID=659017 RepID=UPI0020C77C6A|nr:hypothetical protein [Shinella daejeonensis]MCP8894558.1 hypothetical protein [Shinella daejeonensis]
MRTSSRERLDIPEGVVISFHQARPAFPGRPDIVRLPDECRASGCSTIRVTGCSTIRVTGWTGNTKAARDAHNAVMSRKIFATRLEGIRKNMKRLSARIPLYPSGIDRDEFGPVRFERVAV